MKPRGIAGKCSAGTKLPAHGPCPACGTGPDRECPRARLAEAEELERLRTLMAGTKIEPHKPGAMRLVPYDLLHALWAYGNLHPVEGVIYAGGSHRARLTETQDYFPAHGDQQGRDENK